MSEQGPQPKAPPTRAPVQPGGIAAGRIFGVPLVISRAWFLVVIIAMLTIPATLRDQVAGVGTGESIIAAFGLVVLIYGAVLLHEASHVLVAKALGLRVGRVVLQLFGAQSEILDEPPTAGSSYLVAAVGPMTSILLAGVGEAVGRAFGDHTLGWVMGTTFGWLNGALAAFNLLPGLPLDGGQMLRSGVWHFTQDRLRAVEISAWVGRVIAAAIVAGAVISLSVVSQHQPHHRPTLNQELGVFYAFLVGGFIWINATAAITQVKRSTAIPHLAITSLLRPVLTVEAQLPLAEAVRRARAIGARALVVVDGRDRWSGIVSEAAVQATPIDRQPWISVSDLARPVEAGLVLSPTLYGEALVSAMQETPASEYLVADSDGLLQGVLVSADLVAALQAAGVQ